MRTLSNLEFTRAFRLSHDCFGNLLSIIVHPLKSDEVHGMRSSSGVVEPAVRLGLALRILSGALG
jgi:hypothetical protein